MVEQFFRGSRTIARLRATALGRELDALAEYLQARGHSRVTGPDYLRGAAHFGYWIAAENIAIPEINEEVVARFLKEHVPLSSSSWAAAQAGASIAGPPAESPARFGPRSAV